MTTKIHLDEEILFLKKQLEKLLLNVSSALEKASKAFFKTNVSLAHEIINEDREINDLEVNVEKICLRIFALNQPMAHDLRFLLSTLKINNDLERMGDFAALIAEEVLSLQIEESIIKKEHDLFKDIMDLFEMIQNMLKEAFKSFMDQNVADAKDIFSKDKKVDALYKDIYEKILNKVEKKQLSVRLGVGLININKALERIGDYIKNICEQTVYLKEGKIVKYRLSKQI